MRNDPRGSLWRKWDLHIHSPASFHWKGQRLTGSQPTDDALLGAMLEAIETSDAAAFCIMDYWHFEGWFALRSYLARSSLALPKTVFPGIELRLEAPTDFRLNTHFLFDDTLTDQQLRDFLSLLQIGIVNRAPSREAFIELARTYDSGKFAKHGFSEADRASDDRMASLGEMTAKITRDSWRRAQKQFEERVLVIQPYDTSDGLEKLDWKRHPYDDAELMRAAHFFETRDLLNIRLFLGVGHPTKPQVTQDFHKTLGGRWKPVVAGSDAHRLEDYSVFPGGKAGWIKADTTFAGLRQCTVDPVGRVFVGGEPPKLKHVADNSTKYIERLRVRKVAGSGFAENWFSCDIALNPGMIAIIGNRGGGKSALADILALAGNSHCLSYEFLNTRRFKKPADNKALHFEAILTWANGDDVTVSLASDAKLDQPERVRYLPQQYLEQLCSDVGTEGRTTFEEELRKVIFSHVPLAKRLGFATLDEVVRYRTEQAEEHAAGVRYKLSQINLEIAELETLATPESAAALKAQIQLKETELAAHDSRRPAAAEAATARGQGEDAALVQEMDELSRQAEATQLDLERLRLDQSRLESAAAAAQRIVQRLRNIEGDIRRAIDDAADDAMVAGMEIESLVSYQVDVAAAMSHLESIVTDASAAAEKLVATEARLNDVLERLTVAQERASEPERQYQALLEANREWQKQRDSIVGSAERTGTLEHLRTRLREIQESVPARLAQLSQDRNGLSKLSGSDFRGHHLTVFFTEAEEVHGQSKAV